MNSHLRETTKWWIEAWFVPKDPSLLSCVRIGAGVVAILHFLTLLLGGDDWLGPNGWLNVDAGRYLVGNEVEGTGSLYRWSWLYWYPDSTGLFAGLGLVASAATIAGVGSRLSPFIVWFCLGTFHHRAPLLTTMHEPLLTALMAYLIIDNGRTIWTFRPGLSSGDPRISVNFVLRLMRCHFWIWIAFSLSHMLANSIWWNGEAGWLLTQQSRGLLSLSDGWQWLGQVLTHSVILTQVAILFCLSQSVLHWLGKWMTYLFLFAMLLLLSDWMYASVLIVVSFAVWPIQIPIPKPPSNK